MVKKLYSKDEEKAWSAYEDANLDEMDDLIVGGTPGKPNFADLDKDPIPKSEGSAWGASFEFQRVGNGVQTDSKCGTFRHTLGCMNMEGHNHADLDGVNHAGKGFFKKVFYSCDKPSCPICFKRHYAVREASAIEHTLKLASFGYLDKKEVRHQGLGLVEHTVTSVPACDYSLSFEKMKAKAIRAMRKRGVLGGVLIFHAERFADFREATRRGVPVGWYYACHFHNLGFIDGGYSRCRNCPNAYLGFKGEVRVKETEKCMRCTGFEGRTRREYLKEGGRFGKGGSVGGGYIVKIQGKRNTVFGTAWYQLNHATIVKGEFKTMRSHDKVVTWWGVCGCRKLALRKEDRIQRNICPLCGEEMHKVKYVGEGEPLGDDGWHNDFEDLFLDERGVPKWIVAPEMKVRYQYE